MRVEGAQLSVEILGGGLRVVRVAGVIDAGAGVRIAALVQAQPGPSGACRHLIVDLGEVRWFGVDDLDVLARVRDVGRAAGVHVHLAGLAAREPLLPTGLTDGLGWFSVFDTVEQGRRELASVPMTVGRRSHRVWPCLAVVSPEVSSQVSCPAQRNVMPSPR